MRTQFEDVMPYPVEGNKPGQHANIWICLSYRDTLAEAT